MGAIWQASAVPATFYAGHSTGPAMAVGAIDAKRIDAAAAMIQICMAGNRLRQSVHR
jgi:hypothetical protein